MYILFVDRHKKSFNYFVKANNYSQSLITLFMETLFKGYIIASIGQDLINIVYCYATNRIHDDTCFFIPYKLVYELSSTNIILRVFKCFFLSINS